MSIKTVFSIKDLENLSGIKAHTIRIWEKRYGLLQPMRSDTNIRTYDVQNLQKLLNVSLLNQYGVKISRIAKMDETEVNMRVQELALSQNDSPQAISSFKLAMLNFDEVLFNNTFNQLQTKLSFRDIFLDTFLKLLEDIGLLWATNTISPAHEHFISTLIKRKLLINIERTQNSAHTDERTFVLFLPHNEIHDLGLLYVQFELLLKGYRTVFLGSSVPIESLKQLQDTFEKVCFVSYFTVEPAKDRVEEYLSTFCNEILTKRNEELHILGRNATHLSDNKFERVHIHSDITKLVKSL